MVTFCVTVDLRSGVKRDTNVLAFWGFPWSNMNRRVMGLAWGNSGQTNCKSKEMTRALSAFIGLGGSA